LTSEERRERNRRRWRRRRRRQITALLILLPLLVGAGVLSTNVVSVLGDARRGLGNGMLARPDGAPARDEADAEHIHRQVPVLMPVTDTADLVGKPTVRVTEPLPQLYYEPASHISPHVKWKLSQLRNASLSTSSQPRVAMAHRATQPEQLNVMEAVFHPTSLELPRLDDPLDQFWALETIYVEAAPNGPGVVASAPIPEPGTGVLMSVGLAGLAARRRAARHGSGAAETAEHLVG
jgi:hypothetical protein